MRSAVSVSYNTPYSTRSGIGGGAPCFWHGGQGTRGHYLRGFATSAIFDFANMELVAFGECDMIDRARHTLQSFIKSYYRVTSPDHIGRFRKRLRTNGKILRVEEVLFL